MRGNKNYARRSRSILSQRLDFDSELGERLGLGGVFNMDRTVYQLQPRVLDISIRSSHDRKFILKIRALPP